MYVGKEWFPRILYPTVVSSERGGKIRCGVFTFFRKRHVAFHVLVVQTRERNVQKCAARAEMLFCIIIKSLLFSPRRCRRQSMVAQVPLHDSYVRYFKVRIQTSIYEHANEIFIST